MVALFDAVDMVVDEVRRQDQIHPAGYPATREGVRFGLATLQDELDETLLAWRDERGADSWTATAEELAQAVAVGVRTLRSIVEAGAT